MTPGDKLKRLRMARGLKQEDVAKALYFSNRTISNWENNLRTISAENIRKIADFFQVPVEDFYYDHEVESKSNGSMYQQIRLKQISVNSQYFYILFGFVLLQIFLLFNPFGSRIQLVVMEFLFWTGFTIISYSRYLNLDRLRTKDYLLPIHQKAQYKTPLPPKERALAFWGMILTYAGMILTTFVFYGATYTLFNLFEEETLLLTFILLYGFFMVLGHIIGVVVVIRRGVPQATLNYDKHKYDFGMSIHRSFVTFHYFAIILFYVLISGLPLSMQHLDLVWLIVLVGLFKIIYLRQFLNRITRFFSTYQLEPFFPSVKS